jgi:glycine/D-amino acid oxidase-like deaminating enzyme
MTFDAIVVGGGIVGCTSAFYLAGKGLKVAVVEKGSIGCGTTSATFAWINATSKVADEAYHRLNARGQAIYRELAVEFGEECIGLYPDGGLGIVRKSDASGYAAAKERARLLETFDYPCAWIGARELRAMEPHIVFPDDAEALFSVSDAFLDPPKFARFMADQVRARGGTVLENCAAHELMATDDGVVTGVVTDQGELEAPNVLVTAGPNTPEVLVTLTGYDGFSSRFPMHRVPGLLVTTPSMLPRRLVRHINYFFSDTELHVRGMPDGGLKLGADDTDGMVAEDQSAENVREAARELLRRAQTVIPGFAGEACLDECILDIGVRPYPEDGVSLAGQLPGSQGLFVIATHSGVTLAPALGSLMADQIADGQAPETLKPFNLERFQMFR